MKPDFEERHPIIALIIGALGIAAIILSFVIVAIGNGKIHRFGFGAALAAN